MPRYQTVILTAVVVALVTGRLYQSITNPPASTSSPTTALAGQKATIKPVDGDTFWYNGKKIRVMDIDTPEPSKYGNAECPAEAALGDKASRFTKKVITTQHIQIEWSGREDRYGRALAKVRVGSVYLSEMLISEGLAKPWRGRQVNWCAIL